MLESSKRIEFAVKAIILKNGKFLALHRKDARSRLFDLPGGRMEFGETAEETVIREVREETGLVIKPICILGSWNNVKEDFQIIGIFYLCSANNEPIRLSDEHDEYRWLDANKRSLDEMHPVFRIKMECWDWDKLLKI